MRLFNEQENGFLIELLSNAKYKAEKNLDSLRLDEDGNFKLRGQILLPERASDYLAENHSKSALCDTLMKKLIGYSKLGPKYEIADKVLVEGAPCTILGIIIDGGDISYEVTSTLYESNSWTVLEGAIDPIGAE